ncbi:DMT family transporter [Rhodobacteraceae bacterium RKSG542]|uniref:DMT family transporter n=1 Tax=Pseudovibrio flavus TaxID=2529854 RepID=UPI0012BCB9E4|nr:DMT family transporter [Pseudovibrio flavus]MTI18611.1 DMT family transporter [Pseudovibrio flavus]
MKTNVSTAGAGPWSSPTVQGAVLAIIGFLMLSGTDGIVKYLGAHFSPLTISLVRFFIHALIIVIVAPFYGRSLASLLREFTWVQVLRGTLLSIGSIMMVIGLKYIPITDAIAIFFVQPMVLTVLSVIFLKEQVGMHRWAAVVGGLIGVIIVMRPGSGMFGYYALLPFGCAVTFATYLMVNRLYSGRATQLGIQFSAGLSGAMVLLPVSIIAYYLDIGGPIYEPSVVEAPFWPVMWLVALGGVAVLGHVALVKAFERAPASLLAPLNYIDILSATAMGYFFFSEVPDLTAWIGITLIVLSGLYLGHRERLAAKRARAEQLAALSGGE